ncbi:LysR substrate-binding domain-containing protein [Tomitella fengzijianii]|uniref:LysR substrate-binding domain-containing protein n=1 Tax=Tomitella fengzijianii TaxID=2597660 RepID=UPI00131ACF12|nr:LysR substrate-binding domain-containing protein [Tomitella fengzijianii]
MELRHLRAFLAVAEELHFGRAAERLHIAQSPLSQMIRALEKELGTALFARTTRKVSLTVAGEALIAPARVIEAQAAVARQVTDAAAHGEIGRVSVGFGGASGYAALSGLVRTLADEHPGIELDLRPQSYSGSVTDAVMRGALDMGVVALPAPSAVATQVLAVEDLIVAVPSDHRLAGVGVVTAAELAGERFVTYPAEHGSAVRDAAQALCAHAGFAPDFSYEAPDPFSLLAMVGAGVGVSIVVGSTRRITVDDVAYVRLAGEIPTMPIAMAWLESNPVAAVHTVVRTLRSAVDAG